ncbi:ABC transporter permease subunit [bacterium]|nr:ABC transporter permease subunit [bacterium]
MLKTLIMKEIQEQVSSLRFITGLILCVLITCTAVVILTNNYKQEQDNFQQQITSQNHFLNNYAHTNRIGAIITPNRPPAHFHPLVLGLANDTDQQSFDTDPLPTLFPPLDLIFIITIILSLMALLLSHDGVCGEREKGTLKLILSNNVSRGTVLLSKWIGGTTTLFIPFILSVLFATLYLLVHPSVAWSATDIVTLLFLILGAMTFLSIYFLMGLWISAKVKTSSISILTALFIWIIFTLSIPNLSPYLAAQCFKIPSVNRIYKEIRQLRGIERDKLGRKMLAALTARYQSEHSKFWNELEPMSKEAIRQRSSTDPAFNTLYNNFTAQSREVWKEANRIQAEKAAKLKNNLDDKVKVQIWAAKHIACLSPYANFIYLATDICGTGTRGQAAYKDQAAVYLDQFYNYLSNKEEQIRTKDPAYNNNAFIDISDRPQFIYAEEQFTARFNAILPYWGVLIIFNLIFCILAFTAFIKYDIR